MAPGSNPDALGARNPRLGELRKLIERRNHREASGRFVVDGPVLVTEALATGLIEDLFVDAEVLDAPAQADASDRLGTMLAVAQRAGVHPTPVSPGVLSRIADPVTPQPVVAVLRRPPAAVASDALVLSGDVMVCDALADPGNLGTLVRVAEATGMAAVWVVGPATDPFGPKAVRASAGAVLRVPIAVQSAAEVALSELTASSRQVVGLRSGGADYDVAPLGSPLALVVGSEAHGISAEVSERVDTWVGIPMLGSVESLNAGVAGSVVAFEVARRRRMGSGSSVDAR